MDARGTLRPCLHIKKEIPLTQACREPFHRECFYVTGTLLIHQLGEEFFFGFHWRFNHHCSDLSSQTIGKKNKNRSWKRKSIVTAGKTWLENLMTSRFQCSFVSNPLLFYLHLFTFHFIIVFGFPKKRKE